MALSHKDCPLPNSRIWLAEMDIESDRVRKQKVSCWQASYIKQIKLFLFAI